MASSLLIGGLLLMMPDRRKYWSMAVLTGISIFTWLLFWQALLEPARRLVEFVEPHSGSWALEKPTNVVVAIISWVIGVLILLAGIRVLNGGFCHEERSTRWAAIFSMCWCLGIIVPHLGQNGTWPGSSVILAAGVLVFAGLYGFFSKFFNPGASR